MERGWIRCMVAASFVSAALVSPGSHAHDASRVEKVRHTRAEKTLYIWAGDQARVHPDFLAVIDFDERSRGYGRVLRTVPLPPPATSATSRITATSRPTGTSWPAAAC